ncbi:MAG TPA: 50S ribosomal protein L25/general stress protein Ctc [Stellaceae bacterium]
MPEIHTIRAEARDRAGKGPARETRRQGRVPGVLYGEKEPPQMISVEPRALTTEMSRPGFFARLIEVEIADGDSASKHRVLPRDVQLDPVTDRPLHVDFMRVGSDTPIRVAVPVVFINQGASPGLKRGGILNIVRHDIELICRAEHIPERITIDLDGLEIGDSIHIHSVVLPEGVKPSVSRDFTVASIAAPTAVREEQVAAAAAAAASKAAAAAALEAGEAEGAAGTPGATPAPGAPPAAGAPAGGAAPAKKG